MMDDGLDQAAETVTDHVAASAAEPGNKAKARPSRPAELEPDTPEGVCANCGTELQGPVCHNCGQHADAYHRPVRGLLGEIIEGVFSLDGRVARTIPNLLGRPGRVTRGFLKGHRARYMPPFRLYIIASLIFFLLAPGFDDWANGWGEGDMGRAVQIMAPGEFAEQARAEIEADIQAQVESGEMTEAEAAEARATLDALTDRFVGGTSEPEPGTDPAPGAPEVEAIQTPSTQTVGDPVGDGDEDASLGRLEFSVDRGDGGEAIELGEVESPEEVLRFFAPEDFGEPAPDSFLPLSVRRFMGERFAEVNADPQRWLERAQSWVPRIMFVMVPIYALLLSLVYSWRRRFFFYDHLVVSLHFHSALFMSMALASLIGGGWAFFALLIYSNVYLYRLNRVVYARGRFSSIVRTVTLDFLYSIVLTFALVAVLLLGALAG